MTTQTMPPLNAMPQLNAMPSGNAMPPQLAGAAPDPLLEQLRPNILPDPVSWWPPAPGWWVLAALGIILLGWLLWKSIRAFQRRRYRRIALKAAKQLHQQNGDNNAHVLAHYNSILKIAALKAYPEKDVAGLHGLAWLTFLDESSDTQGFCHGHGKALGHRRYAPAPEMDAQALYELVCYWIKKHHA